MRDRGRREIYSKGHCPERKGSRFGRNLCMACAKEAKEKQEADEKEGDVLGNEDDENQD